ncbi:sirohydrochlorin chelatase [Virgibacillus phasianinus]|uniref:Sirohydrochlorin chelatase n=1 Tax=Virgibacillus phasianinus TaxID=2017483 RepID=A0A220U1Z9_9BACI|nr:sirohydrochlorin chelatase [Virgibacillus phasianinus]ASK62178.1 sirohydrochlorin chelatase [Virgibacillus phasianinus]
MQGILYVSHGSRIPAATTEAISCITSVQERVDVPLQEICFLELTDPTVEQGIDTLVSRGASRIAIVPVLLLSAGHYFNDIPEEVNRAKAKHSHIAFTYGEPLGMQDRFIDVLAERIKETKVPPKPDAKLLLVGRGSRNPQTRKVIENIGQKLRERTNFSSVDVCFLAACNPPFEQTLQSTLKEECSQVFIVPYLWFTGVLVNFIKAKVTEASKLNKEIVLCTQLGNHPTMRAALKERVYESFDEKGSFTQWQ